MIKRVGILDCGLGNIASVARMVAAAGGHANYVSSPEHLDGLDRIILPGVGHFDEGMRALASSGLVQPLLSKVKEDDINVMGICLGMHLLCRGSEEGVGPGLGLVDAEVKKFRFATDKNFKIPHMGWNVVRATRKNLLIPDGDEEQRFYFVHSFRVVPDNANLTIGASNYGGDFCAALQKDNIYGVQFHPEKSHRFGMALMKRFLEL